MIKYDLEHGRIEGKLRSRRRQVASLFGLARYALPRILFVCHKRSYDPTTYPPMAGAQTLLARATEKYGIADPPAAKETA